MIQMRQTVILINKDYKAAIVTMLGDINENMHVMNGQWNPYQDTSESNFQKKKDKDKILKAPREKTHPPYKRKTIFKIFF